MLALTFVLIAATAATSDDAIKVGHVTSLTAGSVDVGVAMANGARLAAEEVNAAGGVLGRKLVVVDVDDASVIEKGVQAAKDLVEKERVVALLGPLNTGVGKLMVRVANERRVPHLVTGNGACEVNELSREFPENYVFRLAASDALQAHMVVTEAFAARGKTKLAILHDATAYGKDNRDRVQALLAQRGAKAAYVGQFDIGQTEMAALVAGARQAGADVVTLWGRGGEDAAVVRAMEKAGWKVDVLGSWQMSNPAFLRAAGAYGEGAVMPQTFIDGPGLGPAQQRFALAYKKRFAKEVLDGANAAAQSYDAVHLLALAIAQAGSTEPARLRAALEDLKTSYDGATGAYDRPWMADDHEGITPAQVVWGAVAKGVVVADERPAR